MAESRFVYVTYIRTTPDRLWRALTDPEVQPQYWIGTKQESDWRPGAAWRIVAPDGTVMDAGEVVEIDPPRKLVLRWRNEFRPELRAEGFSRMSYDIEPAGSSVKLTVTHEIDAPESKLIGAVSNGWPKILSGLKTLLETGEPFEDMRQWKGVKACSPEPAAGR
jgi:uncharacterized protein YndB with AHSA1/START domain